MSEGVAPIPACASSHHKPVVLAEVRGTFHKRYAGVDTPGVYYCRRCADAIGSLGYFTPDPEPTC